MNIWHMTIAAGICLLLIACSRREGVLGQSPVFSATSNISATKVADCVARRWKQSTRQLHLGERAGTITLRAESFFRGVPVGLRIVPDGHHSRVEYFRLRNADGLYLSMVRGCLHHHVIHGAAGTPADPQS
ncbi:hypothetical protein [Burkholderia sp. BE17]|uniref:hypothetical protein n=1 Tax=Burkholderia sp. BE17 TaxID=2656644 RepID=UPI00128BA19E|nr:hypothetical protein [Burkholderia sp. BE17]MPV66903.1 hypothetical protein [Burkholderia sp. BE17]